MTGERRYSDAELRTILERASRSEAHSTHAAAGDGHTIAEIRSIAAQVGIAPDSVDLAAASMTQPVATSAFLGLPVTFHADMSLRLRVADHRLHAAAAPADLIFGGTGAVTREADTFEWYNASRRAFFGVIRRGPHTRVSVITDLAPHLVGAAAITFAGSIAAIGFASAADPTGLILGAGLIGGTYGAVRFYWKWCVRQATTRMQQLLAFPWGGEGPA